MEGKLYVKQARKGMNTVALTVLAYYGIMNFFAILVMLVDLLCYVIGQMIQSLPVDMDGMMQYMMDSVTKNGWGYILSILVGIVIVLAWKKKAFWRNEMFAKNGKMTAGAFFQLLAVFLSAQLFAQLFSIVLEWLLNLMGLSAVAALEAAAITSTGFSMFLYVTILGPISEELLFRGLLLRLIKPWGKQTAILVSALVFGLFHGNIIQIPFAFLVGLVLGYVTVEYSIIWAIVLHIFNNLVMSDLLGRLSSLMTETAGTVLLYGILIVAAAAAVVLLICNRQQVKSYFAENRCDRKALRALVTSPAMIIFTVLMLLMSLLSITSL